MVYKRSFGDEETYELPCKHQRQLDYSNQLPSFAEIAPCNDVPQKPHSSVGEGGAFHKLQGVERIGNDTELTIGADREFDTSVPGVISNLSWVSSSTSEEDLRSEAVVKLLFSPDVVEAGCSTRTSVQHDEIYSSLLDSPPRKLVPIGSDHQAIIPQCAASKLRVDNDNWEKLMGTCLLPMPDSEALGQSSDDLGNGRVDNCQCSDKGAVRCVRQHIFEARDKLRDFLGQEKFMKLGFYEMGEIVARKWTTEEEQLFEDIVFTNPASAGKNFWPQLSEVFPSRSKMDLVSYYFNVFMLRRRAEQNRLEDMKIAPCNNVPQKPHSSGEGGGFSKSQDEERVGNVTELTIGVSKEPETSVPLSWGSSTSEEDSRSEAAVKLFVFPDILEDGCSTRPLAQHDDIYSCLLDSPPRKLVPVGSDHQAIIPQCAASNVMVDNDNWERLMGTCLLPMPDSEALVNSTDEVGKGRVDNCKCSDRGAVRCVQHHIFEARDKLRDFLGQEKFMKLGFFEMGEIVARKWTEDEQQIFRNIVFLNPASYGKNFWTQLSEVFSSRSKMDLVSYYFNVFMLRRRAEQNRSDRMNIDSDNDEWQNSDDGDESGMSDEEEDSAVESLADQDDPDDGDETYDNNDNDNVVNDWVASREEEDDGGIDDVSEVGPEPTPELEDKKMKSRREDHDVQDDSCTSYECQHSGVNHNNQLQGSFNGLRDVVNHGCEMEACDAKVWNVGYITGSKSDIDLLPTSNMIKEVFGEEAWNNKGEGW
ncbi:SANT/Myb domain [Macleaya cordata]|uniref:SANT/Myb domain n=1 Tax=Macleaya cordata TaxID=56857 RepID=A0A200PRE3_MACCD|nr:SANT/Myb domain [Macleaya cordata]